MQIAGRWDAHRLAAVSSCSPCVSRPVFARCSGSSCGNVFLFPSTVLSLRYGGTSALDLQLVPFFAGHDVGQAVTALCPTGFALVYCHISGEPLVMKGKCHIPCTCTHLSYAYVASFAQHPPLRSVPSSSRVRAGRTFLSTKYRETRLLSRTVWHYHGHDQRTAVLPRQRQYPIWRERWILWIHDINPWDLQFWCMHADHPKHAGIRRAMCGTPETLNTNTNLGQGLTCCISCRPAVPMSILA